MVETSTHQNERYDIYEVYALTDHAVTAGEAAANEIVIATVEPHAVVIADEEYARGYADGVLSAITQVEYDTLADPLDTTLTFSSLTEGQIIDAHFPVAGTGSGSLTTNTDTGKLSLPRIQTVQSWAVPTSMDQVSECGTERKRPVEFAVRGSVVLGLSRYGNEALSDFIAARENNIPLLIDVVDTTATLATHDLLLEAKVRAYQRASQASNTVRGIITDTIMFSFVPDVVTFDET